MWTGLIALTAGTMLAGAAVAQEAIIDRQGPDDLLGGWVIGAAVDSPGGERIGSIDDILIDASDGRITAGIVSVGGFLGFGAKDIAVDWEEFDINWDAREVILSMTRDEMEAAEEFEYRDREFIPAPADAGGDAMGGGAMDGGGTMDGGGALGGN